MFRFPPYPALEATPNVIVDGAAQSASLITLSHWPHSGAPAELKDDLSTEIAFHYLDQPMFRVDADVVSNNHSDQDGLVGVYTLVDTDNARARRELLIDVAAAGIPGQWVAESLTGESFMAHSRAVELDRMRAVLIDRRAWSVVQRSVFVELAPDRAVRAERSVDLHVVVLRVGPDVGH
jgi:hypothetical protein